MKKRILLNILSIVSLITFALIPLLVFPQVTIESSNLAVLQLPNRAEIVNTYNKLPMIFEVNQGQVDKQIRFLSRGNGYTIFLAPNETILALRKPVDPEDHGGMSLVPVYTSKKQSMAIEQAILHMKLVGSNSSAEIVGMDELPGKVNYFIGKDSTKWRADIPTYARVKYHNVYPGVDLVYYGNQRNVEYDFIVAPGVDPDLIGIELEGVEKLEIDAQGDLILYISNEQIRMRKPLIHQEIEGCRKEIAGGYVIKDEHKVGFRVAAFDATRPLIIDPVLSYSTYLGGTGFDQGLGITVDTSGNFYLTGFTTSNNFPITGGAFQTGYGGADDAFVTKINASGSALVYSTYIGGSSPDWGFDIIVDSSGNAYVTGQTSSTNFPTTTGAFQTTYGGGTKDAFVAKLNPTGSSLIYSTYLGGSNNDVWFEIDIAVDNVGNAYVTGGTISPDFPTTAGAYQTINKGNMDVYVTKLNTTGSGLVYSTCLGGFNSSESGRGIVVDEDGNAYITGSVGQGSGTPDFPTTIGAYQPVIAGGDDAFVVKLNPTGSDLVYSTHLGSNGLDYGRSIAIDINGNAYITGWTNSLSFPTTSGAFQITYSGNYDVFVTKLNTSGAALIYSTYLGSTGDENGDSIVVDAFDNAYITGLTTSTDFPTANPFQASSGGGTCIDFTDPFGEVHYRPCHDAFVTKLNTMGSGLIFSSYLGGGGDDQGLDIALSSANDIFVVGITEAFDFPTLLPLQPALGGSADAFVIKISENQPPITDAGGPYIVNEGNSTLVTASGSDPNGVILTYNWDLDNNGSFETPGQSVVFSAAGVDGPNNYTIAVQVTNSDGLTATDQASVNVLNVAPTVGSITAPVDPVQVNSAINTNANFTDSGTLDTHTAIWDWGNTSTSSGMVSETNGSGTVTGTHTYTTPGVYTVKVTVTDGDNDSDQSIFQFVVVYDPKNGFVTGGGWINSPSGAYTANPSLYGKANFGFVSKYEHGATVPTGQTEFQFKVADFNFHSASYDWLVVAGPHAKFKGSGTINGAGDFGFILTATDGQMNGGEGVDKFRIKIWEKATNVIIYDNQLGYTDDAGASDAIEGGSISIHK
jgi:hypothetical protein